jgi:hypothetical protein
LNQNHQLALVMVADGMGGHAGGDQAARLALRTIGGMLAPLLTSALNAKDREITRAGLTNSIDAAIRKQIGSSIRLPPQINVLEVWARLRLYSSFGTVVWSLATLATAESINIMLAD